jgi:hypothetical protein
MISDSGRSSGSEYPAAFGGMPADHPVVAAKGGLQMQPGVQCAPPRPASARDR